MQSPAYRNCKCNIDKSVTRTVSITSYAPPYPPPPHPHPSPHSGRFLIGTSSIFDPPTTPKARWGTGGRRNYGLPLVGGGGGGSPGLSKGGNLLGVWSRSECRFVSHPLLHLRICGGGTADAEIMSPHPPSPSPLPPFGGGNAGLSKGVEPVGAWSRSECRFVYIIYYMATF